MNEISKMTDKEVDEAVAHEVMGFVIRRRSSTDEDAYFTTNGMYGNVCDWRPTHNIAHAWQVVEKFNREQIGVEIINHDPDTFRFGQWEAIINGYYAIAHTAPRAITLAALEAKRSSRE